MSHTCSAGNSLIALKELAWAAWRLFISVVLAYDPTELTLTRRCLHLKQPFRDFLANGRTCDGAPPPMLVGFILDTFALKGRSKDDKSRKRTGESDTLKSAAARMQIGQQGLRFKHLDKSYMSTCQLRRGCFLGPTMMTHSTPTAEMKLIPPPSLTTSRLGRGHEDRVENQQGIWDYL